MSNILNVPKVAEQTAVDAGSTPYIDWTSVVAGALVGIAIIATLTAFGSAVGLSLTSPYQDQSTIGFGIAVAITIWTMWVVISGHIAAGYIAGRMRHIGVDTSVEEAEIRNGAHGLVAWAITTILVAALTAFAMFGGTHAVTNNTSRAGDHVDYVADQLLRSDRPDATYNEGLHREVASVLRTAAHGGKLSDQDKTYLVRLVAARGTANGDAAQRVDAAIADVKNTTDKERKIGVLVGFLTAASLAVGAAAAWWAARIGGKHRLDYRGISVFTRWH
jgi:hypothetical protein